MSFTPRNPRALSTSHYPLAFRFLTLRQNAQNLLQSLANLLDSVRGFLLGKGQARLLSRGLGFIFQLLARGPDGEALVVKRLLVLQNFFYAALAVHALAGTALHRLQLGKLRLPKAQHVGRQ